MNKYSSILKKIQEATCATLEWGREAFYQDVVKGIFVKNMGYESGDSYIKEYVNTFQRRDLMILGSVEEKYERGFSPLL